jgi:hypothetical protein
VYPAEGGQEAIEPDALVGTVPDAGSVDWKAALRVTLMLAVPAGMVSNLLSPLGVLGALLMAMTASWVVVLYMRDRRPAWITMSAGARIGLVTGMVGGWTAAATTGVILFASRFWFHQGKFFDDLWQNLVSDQLTPQWVAMGIDQQHIAMTRDWLLSPEGRAGWLLGALSLLVFFLLAFSMAGGAIGARIVARSRRPQI